MNKYIITTLALLTILLFQATIGFANMNDKSPCTNPRKEKTEAELKRLNVPINPWLPLIESEEEARIRAPQEVAKRAIILYSLAAVGHGIERNKVIESLKKENLWEHVSPTEKSFFEDSSPSQRDRVQATWRVEALWVLLWALGEIDTLDFPTSLCDVEKIHQLLQRPEGIQQLIKNAKLRTTTEILDETDKIYRLHWAVRDAQLNDKPIPAGVDSGVVMERHYALNWLTYYADEWDDITTDT